MYSLNKKKTMVSKNQRGAALLKILLIVAIIAVIVAVILKKIA